MKTKLNPLDIVRTQFGTLAVVDRIADRTGDVSLVLPIGSTQKYAWYRPEELTFVGTVKDLVAQVAG